MKILYFTMLALCWGVSAEAALYRWVDEAGKVHYGDKIPPVYAQNGHTKLRKNGMTEERVDSAEDRKRKIEEIKAGKALQELREAKQHEANLQEMRDTQLRSMFSSIDDLEAVYQSKLEMAKVGIEVLQARHKKLSESLELLEARHERLVNPNDKNKLGMKIEDILDNLHIYQQAITDNQIEYNKIKELYRNDLVRYVIITSGNKKVEKPADS